MKILYAIQGTGNGHLSRARDIIPILQDRGDLDILVSGTQADISLPYPIKYRLRGLSFIFGKKGGVDFWKTLVRNNLRGVMREIKSVPVQEYDLVINDFEPISAWACFIRRKTCIALSHQSAVLSEKAPLPSQTDRLGKFILKNYAPATVGYGFHFSSFDPNIYTPVIRREVRNLQVTDNGHYTVYLPSYSDKKIIKILKKFPYVNWQVFSKHNKKSFNYKNIDVQPIANEAFLSSLASCRGVLCGAGFETPAEALFLNKKLMVIPMKNQYEQNCNAAALKVLGVPVMKSLKKKQIPTLGSWLESGEAIHVKYPDLTENIVDLIIQNHLSFTSATEEILRENLDSGFA